MMIGLSGRVHDAQNVLFLTLETPTYFLKNKKTQTYIKKLLFLETIKSRKSEMSKRRVPEILKIRHINS